MNAVDGEPIGTRRVRRLAAFSFQAQGVLVFAWWGMLVGWPGTRGPFQLQREGEGALLAFWLSDLLLLGIGSLLAGVLLRRRARWAGPVVWLVTGASASSTATTLAWALREDVGWLGVVMMMVALIWIGTLALVTSVDRRMFRASRSASTAVIMGKTLAQLVSLWGLILYVIPKVLVRLEAKLSWPTLSFSFQQGMALVLFLAMSSIGIASALEMSRVGCGTPLPLDHATKLVLRGPYAYVRNPMAVAGIGQALCVALGYGSGLVALYAIFGALIWQGIFRPIEEDDLERRFGESYADYRAQVRCWVPRHRPYPLGRPLKESRVAPSPSEKPEGKARGGVQLTEKYGDDEQRSDRAS